MKLLVAGLARTYGWRPTNPTNPASIVVYLPNGYGDGDPLTVAVRYRAPSATEQTRGRADADAMGETGQATDRDRSTVDAKRSRSWLGWIAAYFVTIYLIWFFVSAVILALAASEGGSVPPTWRDPDIPAGAEVVSASEVCGGNGPCWRELRIRPAEGQDASDLAAEMGLSEDESRTYGWRPTNPASVEVFLPYGRLGQQYLKVGVQYASPFPFP